MSENERMHDETKARQERRERRFSSIAEPTVNEAKRQVKHRVRKLREEEKNARRRSDEEQADTYRRAANALENALAELEEFDA